MQQVSRPRMAVVLAAGDGKRMKSDQPKVLCEVLFKPMIRWVEDACRAAGIDRICIVTGAGGELVRAAVSEDCCFAAQAERLGTGHAVLCARAFIPVGTDVLVLNGDAPFVTPGVISGAHRLHTESGSALTLVSAILDNPTGYGRVFKNDSGAPVRIVEEKDADRTTRSLKEVNSGAYWFDSDFLLAALQQITTQNVQGEYYLTDLVGIAVAQGKTTATYVCEDASVIRGANDRRQLRDLHQIARELLFDRHLENGVDIPCEDGILIGPDVQIGPGARILPGSILRGNTQVGACCEIGPHSILEDAVIGAGCRVLASCITRSQVGDGTTIGPFSQLRPGCQLGREVKIGDFVELKNTTLGDQVSVAHLTYLGDSDVGDLCNFGCGVVTANYDGVQKYRTTIGSRAFIGCNTNIIPPVNIGAGAYTAAGVTVNRDIPDGALAHGRVRQEIREGWADRHIHFKAGRKPADNK